MAEPKILSFRIVSENEQLFVVCEYGEQSIRKEIPADKSVSRMSAIFGKGIISDVEIVCVK